MSKITIHTILSEIGIHTLKIEKGPKRISINMNGNQSEAHNGIRPQNHKTSKRMKRIAFNAIMMVVMALFISCGNRNKEADELRLQGEFEKAAELYKQAAERGDGYACFRLGKCYETGLGVDTIDKEKAFDLYKKGSERGCIQAQVEEAVCYRDGIGIDRDEEKGVKMIENLAKESNHPYAKARLAALYVYGVNGLIEQDHKKALSILEECEEEPYGLRLLGVLYCWGDIFVWDDGHETDYPKAMEYFKRAYELGDGYSAAVLGGIIYKVSRDLHEAISWYIKAANMGETTAMKVLVTFYVQNGDLKQSLSWLRKAAKLGQGWAYYLIGIFYESGKGVEKDDDLAFMNYKKAAELRDADGTFNLAFCYLNGIGTTKNFKEAEKWYIKAAEYGSGEAAWTLYCIYKYGKYGAYKDESKAEQFLQKAVKAKQPTACHHMGDLYYWGIDVETNYQQAFTYWKLAADQGDLRACRKVANCYREGIGCDKDLKKAEEYEERSKDTDF